MSETDKIFDKRAIWNDTPFPELYASEEEMRVCETRAGRTSSADLVLVHHLHENFLHYVEALSNCYDVHRIVGIPYSAEEPVVAELSEEYDVRVPDDVSAISGEVVAAVESADDEVIISEIGGYTCDESAALDRDDRVLGVVEDTNQGHWRWEAVDDVGFPVVSVADSRIKRIEEQFVAKSLVNALARFLDMTSFNPLSESTVQLLGYGNIGKAIAPLLAEQCQELSVFDTDPIENVKAGVRYSNVRNLSDADIVFGVTGNPDGSIQREHIDGLLDGTLLASGSSKKVEFDIESLDRAAESIETNDYSTRYTIDGRDIHLVNDGEPINFRFSRLPTRVLDLVYAGLVDGINMIADSTAEPGLSDLPEQNQQRIAETYLAQYDG
jgi:adenosylhomocysteinase